jgi:hypothetical protein
MLSSGTRTLVVALVFASLGSVSYAQDREADEALARARKESSRAAQGGAELIGAEECARSEDKPCWKREFRSGVARYNHGEWSR